MPGIRTDGPVNDALWSLSERSQFMKNIADNLYQNFIEKSQIFNHRTRNRADLRIPRVRLEFSKRTFYFIGVPFINWNDIREGIRETRPIARFKRELRSIYFNAEATNATPWSSSNSYYHQIFVTRLLFLEDSSCISIDEMKNK